MTTMALSMICHSLLEASFAVESDNRPTFYSKQAVKNAYAFIQGTGLEVTIMEYHLNLDAGRLRDEFNKLFK